MSRSESSVDDGAVDNPMAHLNLRNQMDLTKELERLFNRLSVDADCGIHDFLLAEFVVSQLQDLKLLQYSLKKMKGEL